MSISLNEEVDAGVASQMACLGPDPRKGDFAQGSPLVHTPDGSKAGRSGWAGSAALIPARCTMSITSYSLWPSSYFTGSFNLILLGLKVHFFPISFPGKVRKVHSQHSYAIILHKCGEPHLLGIISTFSCHPALPVGGPVRG